MPFSEADYDALQREGIVRMSSVISKDELTKLGSAVQSILQRYPYGFISPPLYSGLAPTPRAEAPKVTDRAPTIIVPHAGFLAPEILAPLANPDLHTFLEKIVGVDFYLSNTWFQIVPPGTGRLAYHKDPRGSITFNILLDDIGPSMGSTCLVPKSHVNTPPPRYCMENIQEPHPREMDVCGHAGDTVFFSPETWHGRSENRSDKWTRRLFFNFYSRSSRSATAWSGVVDDASIAAARKVLPAQYHHMFRIDADLTKQLAAEGGGVIRRWSLKHSSSESLFRDFIYAWNNYGYSADHTAYPGFLLPYTTRLIEDSPFSVRRYLSQMRAKPTAKNAMRYLQQSSFALSHS